MEIVCPICNNKISGFFAVGYIFYFFPGRDDSQNVLHTSSLVDRLWDASLHLVRHPFFVECLQRIGGRQAISIK